MIKFKKLNLFARLLLVFLPFLILSILLVSVVLTATSYRFFLKNISQDYKGIIKSSAGEIRLFMDNAAKELQSLAMVLAATNLDHWQQEMALASFSHSASEFMALTIVSADGKELNSSGQQGEHVVYSQSETFKKALSGKVGTSEVLLTKENIPYVHMAVPVYYRGKIVGALWADLNLKAVWDVLEGINIGKTGTIYIMDLSGRLVGNRDINSVVNSREVAGPEIVEKLRNAGESPVEWNDPRPDGNYYSLGYTIPHLEWVIVLNQLDREIYAYLYDNIRWATLITLLISACAIILGWNRMKHFLAPIHDLHRQTKKIGQGDLEHHITIDSEDEIAELGAAFNEMATALKTYINKEIAAASELAHMRSLAIIGTDYSHVTHEFGNYLNIVYMIIGGMKTESFSAKTKRFMELLENDTDRISMLVKDCMQLARKPDPKFEKTSLEGLIRDLFFTHQMEANARGIELRYEWSPELPIIRADLRLMHQVLSNLLKNALEAMPDSGSIRIAGRVEGEHLKLAVEDTGSGMTQDVLSHIFDPFYTTKKRQGTGLGLSICKAIMEAHRGTIQCSSEIGKGTSFTLLFPLL